MSRKQSNKSRPTAGNPQLLRWSVTISCMANPTVDEHVLTEVLDRIASKWAFQQEMGTEGKYLHYQVQMELKEKHRCSEVQSMLQPITVSRSAISGTSNNGAAKGNGFSYAMKDETRVKGPWTNLKENPRFADIKKGFWPWQEKANRIPYSKRDIHLICDEKGENGKTVFAEWWAFRERKAIYMMNYFITPLELMQIAFEFSKENKNTWFIIDLPRVKPSGQHLKLLTDVIEKLANGVVQETRYKAKQKLLGLTKVLVMSNYDLDLEMTHGRIHKWKIEDKDLVPTNYNARSWAQADNQLNVYQEVLAAEPIPPSIPSSDDDDMGVGAAAVTSAPISIEDELRLIIKRKLGGIY